MKRGTIWMSLGLMMIIAALGLTGYNLWDEKRAEESAADVVRQIEELQDADDTTENDVLESKPGQVLKQYPDIEMPTIVINGIAYIGTLKIPAYDLELPVIEEWSYPNFRIAPCRYTGSVYRDDLIIAAHNYSRHFGNLKNLISGDKIIFKDVDKNKFVYEVAETETLEKTDVEKMESGEWDLTLFTCTYGGRTRVTVRCDRIM